MSIHVMSDVWKHSPYTELRLLIHLALADYANDDGEAWPLHETIAAKCRCTVRTVERTVDQMVEDGVVTVVESRRRARSGQPRFVYKVTATAPATPDSGTGVTPDFGDTTPDFDDTTPDFGDIRHPTLATNPGGLSLVSEPSEVEPSLEPPGNRGDAAASLAVTPSARSPKQRERDDIAEAVIAVCGWDRENVTPAMWSRLGKVVTELLAANATPDEVHARAAIYRASLPRNMLTPTALAARWPDLNRMTAEAAIGINDTKVDGARRQVRAQGRRDRLVEMAREAERKNGSGR